MYFVSIQCALDVGPLAPLGQPAAESALLPADWCPIRNKDLTGILNSGLCIPMILVCSHENLCQIITITQKVRLEK